MVASYTQLILKRYAERLDQDGREFIAFAREGAIRAEQLINDLLEYSRVGRHGLKLQKTDCNKVVAIVLAGLKLALEESKVQVVCGKLPVVMADESQLIQLFQNLISNAVKFRKSERARIDVSAIQTDGEWIFSVKDNGIGIPFEHAERIFVIFQRLHTREEYPGTGIGLAICKKIVERHKGKIWMESKAGEGAAFFFTIPATKALT